MNESQMIAYLGSLDARLFSPEFMDFLLSLPDEQRKELNALRKRIAVLYNGLTNQRLAAIAGRLEAIADDFTTAGQDLDQAIAELNDAANVVQRVARVADLATKVIVAV